MMSPSRYYYNYNLVTKLRNMEDTYSDSISKLEAQWDQLILKMNLTDTAKPYVDVIVEKYTEDHRSYHTVDHILDCLDELNRYVKNKKSTESTDKVDLFILELAIWFHDIVYNPKASDNEYQSMVIASDFGQQMKIEQSRVDLLKQLILDTKTHKCPNSVEGQLVVDIDLSILGRDPEVFWQYERDIRKEYIWVPHDEYMIKREKLLKTLMASGNIYCTSYFRKRYENQARNNLKSLFEMYEKELKRN